MNVGQTILDTAQQLGVDPRLALEVAQEESGLNQAAHGAGGEIGIYQLMPSTAAELGVDPYDTAQNIRGGILYLRQQLSRFGDVAAALAAYNWGPGNMADAIRTHGENWLSAAPARTRSYIANILGRVETLYTKTVSAPAAAAAVLDQAKKVDPELWKKLLVVAGLFFGVYFLADFLGEA